MLFLIKMKKGQVDTKNVAILVFVMGLLMLAYVLLIPPEDRRQLLGEDNDTSASGSTSKSELLLLESPGLLSPTKENEIKHEINLINLYVKTEPEIINLADTISVSNSLFSSNSPTYKFEIGNLMDLKKVVLFFTAAKSGGELKINLNGNLFYSESLKDSTLKAVEIPLSYLKDTNELKFSTSLFGSYTLKEVDVKKEFEYVHSREKRDFIVSSQEKEDMSKATLNYYYYCNYLKETFSNLKIYLNRETIFSGLLRCVSNSASIEIPAEALVEGSNELLFTLEEGDFQISQIRVISEGKEGDFPIYHFEVDPDEYDLIENDEKNVNLDLTLSKEGFVKRGKLEINGVEVVVQTPEISFSKDISSYIRKGDNVIRIVPGNEFTISKIEIRSE